MTLNFNWQFVLVDYKPSPTSSGCKVEGKLLEICVSYSDESCSGFRNPDKKKARRAEGTPRFADRRAARKKRFGFAFGIKMIGSDMND